MPTSGIISTLATVQDFGRMAMQEIGALSAGEMPTAQEGEVIIQRLNWMLKSWQAEGCNLWRDASSTVVFGIGVSTVTLAPRVIDVIDARAIVSATNERALARWEPADYRRLPNKASAGSPTAFMLTKGIGAVTMTVWPVPTVATTISYAYARVIEDVTALVETIDVPQEWSETVLYGLAARLANVFGATLTDAASVERVTAYAAVLERKLLDFDRPASVYMGSATRRRWR